MASSHALCGSPVGGALAHRLVQDEDRVEPISVFTFFSICNTNMEYNVHITRMFVFFFKSYNCLRPVSIRSWSILQCRWDRDFLLFSRHKEWLPLMALSKLIKQLLQKEAHSLPYAVESMPLKIPYLFTSYSQELISNHKCFTTLTLALMVQRILLAGWHLEISLNICIILRNMPNQYLTLQCFCSLTIMRAMFLWKL